MKSNFKYLTILLLFSCTVISQQKDQPTTCDCSNQDVYGSNAFKPYGVNVTGEAGGGQYVYILTAKIDNPIDCDILLRVNSTQAVIEGGQPEITVPAGANSFVFTYRFTAINYSSVSFSYNTKPFKGSQCSNSNFNVDLPKICTYTLSSSGNIVTINNTCNQNLWLNFYGPPECTVSPVWVQVLSGTSIEQPILITQINPNLMDPVSVFYKVFNADKSVMCDHKNVKIPRP